MVKVLVLYAADTTYYPLRTAKSDFGAQVTSTTGFGPKLPQVKTKSKKFPQIYKRHRYFSWNHKIHWEKHIGRPLIMWNSEVSLMLWFHWQKINSKNNQVGLHQTKVIVLHKNQETPNWIRGKKLTSHISDKGVASKIYTRQNSPRSMTEKQTAHQKMQRGIAGKG